MATIEEGEIAAVLWHGTPEHRITAITAVSHESSAGGWNVFTADDAGKLFLWCVTTASATATAAMTAADKSATSTMADKATVEDVATESDSNTLALEPRSVLLAHTSPIVSLCSLLSECAESLVLSAGADGTICLWSGDDGCCVAQAPMLCHALAPISQVVPMMGRRYMVVTGDSSAVQVLDPLHMVVIATFHAHTDVVLRVAACPCWRSEAGDAGDDTPDTNGRSRFRGVSFFSAGADGRLVGWRCSGLDHGAGNAVAAEASGDDADGYAGDARSRSSPGALGALGPSPSSGGATLHTSSEPDHAPGVSTAANPRNTFCATNCSVSGAPPGPVVVPEMVFEPVFECRLWDSGNPASASGWGNSYGCGCVSSIAVSERADLLVILGERSIAIVRDAPGLETTCRQDAAAAWDSVLTPSADAGANLGVELPPLLVSTCMAPPTVCSRSPPSTSSSWVQVEIMWSTLECQPVQHCHDASGAKPLARLLLGDSNGRSFLYDLQCPGQSASTLSLTVCAALTTAATTPASVPTTSSPSSTSYDQEPAQRESYDIRSSARQSLPRLHSTFVVVRAPKRQFCGTHSSVDVADSADSCGAMVVGIHPHHRLPVDCLDSDTGTLAETNIHDNNAHETSQLAVWSLSPDCGSIASHADTPHAQSSAVLRSVPACAEARKLGSLWAAIDDSMVGASFHGQGVPPSLRRRRCSAACLTTLQEARAEVMLSVRGFDDGSVQAAILPGAAAVALPMCPFARICGDGVVRAAFNDAAHKDGKESNAIYDEATGSIFSESEVCVICVVPPVSFNLPSSCGTSDSSGGASRSRSTRAGALVVAGFANGVLSMWSVWNERSMPQQRLHSSACGACALLTWRAHSNAVFALKCIPRRAGATQSLSAFCSAGAGMDRNVVLWEAEAGPTHESDSQPVMQVRRLMVFSAHRGPIRSLGWIFPPPTPVAKSRHDQSGTKTEGEDGGDSDVVLLLVLCVGGTAYTWSAKACCLLSCHALPSKQILDTTSALLASLNMATSLVLSSASPDAATTVTPTMRSRRSLRQPVVPCLAALEAARQARRTAMDWSRSHRTALSPRPLPHIMAVSPQHLGAAVRQQLHAFFGCREGDSHAPQMTTHAPASPFAVSELDRYALSLLLSWGTDHSLDSACAEQIGIFPPRQAVGAFFGMVGAGKALTLVLPQPPPKQLALAPPTTQAEAQAQARAIAQLHPSLRPWCYSARMTASLAFAVVFACMALMQSPEEELQLLVSRLVTQYTVVLPDLLQERYCEPALDVLAMLGLFGGRMSAGDFAAAVFARETGDCAEAAQEAATCAGNESCTEGEGGAHATAHNDENWLAAHLLLQGSIARMSDAARSTAIAYWTMRLQHACPPIELSHVLCLDAALVDDAAACMAQLGASASGPHVAQSTVPSAVQHAKEGHSHGAAVRKRASLSRGSSSDSSTAGMADDGGGRARSQSQAVFTPGMEPAAGGGGGFAVADLSGQGARERQHAQARAVMSVPQPSAFSRLRASLPTASVLAVFAAYNPNALDAQTSRVVASLLLMMLHAENGRYCAAATEMLHKGMSLWQRHFDETQIGVLLSLSVHAPSLATRTATQRTALELGTAIPHRFIRVVGHELRKSGGAGGSDVDVAMTRGSAGAGPGPGEVIHQSAVHGAAGSKTRANAAKYCCLLLRTLVLLLKKDPAAILPHLPAVAEVMIGALDPAQPDMRRGCLKACTKGLHELVKRFPMTSFHKSTQRFAVGTIEAVIIIYDLRTATKWRVLEGHRSPVVALAFSPNGSQLGSYSSEEATVRSWDTGRSGFFGDILSIQGRCLKEVKLQRTKQPSSAVDVLKNCDFSWIAKKQVALAREDGSQLRLKI